MKNFIAKLTEQDLQTVEELINTIPLGNINLKQAMITNAHAQSIMDFLSMKLTETDAEWNPIIPDQKEKVDKSKP